MRRKILILMLWVFPLCFCIGAEFPEHSFDSSNNECFVEEDYGSPMLRSPARPVPNEPGLFEKIFHGFGGDWWSEGSEDWDRIRNDQEWPSYVDPEYWDEFKENYPQYWEDVEEYFDKHPDAPNNLFRLSLIEDIGAIIGIIFMVIAYVVHNNINITTREKKLVGILVI